MSLHYSKFALNTYLGTPYFQAQIPDGYPIYLVLQKYRAFRRLPPNLKELATLSKQWASRYPERYTPGHSADWYDESGYELDPTTHQRLTDDEIDDQWGPPDPDLNQVPLNDIPRPPDGFPDPATWDEPSPVEQQVEEDGPSVKQMMQDVASRGPEWTAKAYGLAEDELPTSTDTDSPDWDTAKAQFARRKAAVMVSPYFKRRRGARKFLARALQTADIYDDLGGRAEKLFDRAEAAIGS